MFCLLQAFGKLIHGSTLAATSLHIEVFRLVVGENIDSSTLLSMVKTIHRCVKLKVSFAVFY